VEGIKKNCEEQRLIGKGLVAHHSLKHVRQVSAILERNAIIMRLKRICKGRPARVLVISSKP